MSSTIESTHNKIIEKVNVGRSSIKLLKPISAAYKLLALSRIGKKFTEAVAILDNLHMNLIDDALETVENNYNLSIATILNDYYSNNNNEEKNTRNYYRVITSENFCGELNVLIGNISKIVDSLYQVLALHIMSKIETRDAESSLENISRSLSQAQKIEITIVSERRNYEICKCGSRMTIIPELSELVCPEGSCGKVKKMVGVVFRDDQFYPQEGQKTKHGGYDESRHYRFWMERLQANETINFLDSEKTAIEYVISRDNIIRKELNCEIIRDILKDPAVSATHLNDHAPLLIKTLGGQAPPQLDFQENKVTSMKFTKAMKLYDLVNPEGGNKPYYPYFIYKIIEQHFAYNHEKLRLLDYIHLQSRETVIKNDKFWEKMCEISDIISYDKDGKPIREFIYCPTDPAGRL